MEALWAVCLDTSFPNEVPEQHELPVALMDYCQRLGLLPQRTFGELLQDPHTELAVIEVLKKYTKQRSAESRSKEERLIANTLYYSAIAYALVYHKKRISSYGYQRLAEKFQQLSKHSWMGCYYLDLFEKALKQCQT